jgi:uncharacterized protein (TIGR03437 family)
MPQGLKPSAAIRATSLSLLLGVAVAAQLPQGLYLRSVPTGLQPVGVDMLAPTTSVDNPAATVVVANSGDDSLSFFSLDFNLSLAPAGRVTGIPSPYAVSACPYDGARPPALAALVTSPSDNSVRAVGLAVGTVKVGREPRAVACFLNPATKGLAGVVSNAADNSLTVFDASALTVTATIPNVPAARGLHGIGVFSNGSGGSVAWVAGTDANAVTLVDLTTFRVLAQIPVAGPTAVFDFGSVGIASAGSNELLFYGNPGLQINWTTPNVPSPQDAVDSVYGLFAVVPGQASVWFQPATGFPGGAGTLLGIPGAAAIAATTLAWATECLNKPCPPTPFASAVLVTSTSSNSLFLIDNRPPSAAPSLPATFSVLNAASFAPSTAAGSLASAMVGTGVSGSFPASPSAPPPTSLGGVTLRIGGSFSLTTNPSTLVSSWAYSSAGAVQAPLLFVGPNQVNFQIPPGIMPANAVPAQLTRPDGTTLLTTLNITATAPGIFSVLQNGQGQGAVQNVDYSQNGNPQSIVGARPAARGGIIIIYGTGAGDTTPLLATGEAAPASGNPLVLTKVQPSVTIGGKNTTVLFSGLAPGFVGLWQINAVVPADVTPGTAVSLVVTAAGVPSNTVTIAVQ